MVKTKRSSSSLQALNKNEFELFKIAFNALVGSRKNLDGTKVTKNLELLLVKDKTGRLLPKPEISAETLGKNAWDNDIRSKYIGILIDKYLEAGVEPTALRQVLSQYGVTYVDERALEQLRHNPDFEVCDMPIDGYHFW